MSGPTRPGQIPYDTWLSQLAAGMERHTAALFEHRVGLTVLTDAELAGHALSELAYATALADRVLAGRWVVAIEALSAGATHEQVAAATDMGVDELVTGLRSWAEGQRRLGLITPDRHAEVLALLPGQDAEGGVGDE